MEPTDRRAFVRARYPYAEARPYPHPHRAATPTEWRVYGSPWPNAPVLGAGATRADAWEAAARAGAAEFDDPPAPG
jgi:hypothetical protein